MLLISPVWAKTKVRDIHESSVLVYNISQNRIEYSRNAQVQRPIASVTKIMTAMITLDHDKDLGKTLRLSTRVGSYLPVQNYNRWQLLQAMLVKSDNAAAETLAADYPGGREAFIRAMNAKARSLRMPSTHFVDPSGLSRGNVSSAGDLNQLLIAASGYDFIRRASIQKQATFEVYYGQQIRRIELPNTNRSLLFEFDNIVVSKTGFTTPAGWCVGMVVEQGRDVYVIVVLGSRTKALRYATAKELMINHVPDRAIVDLDLEWRVE